MLFRLLSASQGKWDHTVVSLGGEGVYGARMRALGVNVVTLNIPRSGLAPRALWRLYRLIRTARPNVVQTWMYHANFIGGVLARLAGVRSVAWGIRNSLGAKSELSASARVVARACALLSRTVPAAIICNSTRAAVRHGAEGYALNKLIVIPNGFDLSVFSIDAEARHRLRRDWKLTKDDLLLGLVARWDAQKDHANFLHAMALLIPHHPTLKCVLVGQHIDGKNSPLVSLINALGLRSRVILAGPRDDIPAIMNALDLHVLSSAGESFPNAVAESMACGTPCIVTDVGDAASIVGDPDWVAPPRDAAALAKAIENGLHRIAQEGRAALGLLCRERIALNFSLQKAVAAFDSLWHRLAQEVVVDQ